jgi:methionyl aminopeptidase
VNGGPILKTRDEIACMRASGLALAGVLREVSAVVRPGLRTRELDEAARASMEKRGVKSSFLGYGPWGKPAYPAVICISVDDEVVHGIPGERELREGEIVSLDCGVKLGPWHADMAVTLPVGQITERKRRLIDTCRSALWAGIREMRAGATLGAVGQAIQKASKGYGVVAGYGGHGIGRALHEPPFVPNRLDQPFENIVLQDGVVLALEPMLNLGGPEVREKPDQWTVVTADGLASAHFEHTVAVVDGKFEVLTLEPDPE